MTADEVENLIARFRRGGSLARKAGFDGVEIHGANHYAVHQFFSPRANHRDRLLGRHAFQAHELSPRGRAGRSRHARSKLIAGFRITPFEAEAGGYTLDDAKLLCNELARLNLDYISVSLDDYRMSRPTGEARVYDRPVEKTACRPGARSRNLPELSRGAVR